MANILSNAFSLQMLQGFPANITVSEIDHSEIVNLIASGEIQSAIGHADLAAVLTDIFGVEVAPNRVNVALEKGDILFVAQLMGGRLPEGATTLPEGFTLKFLKVELN